MEKKFSKSLFIGSPSNGGEMFNSVLIMPDTSSIYCPLCQNISTGSILCKRAEQELRGGTPMDFLIPPLPSHPRFPPKNLPYSRGGKSSRGHQWQNNKKGLIWMWWNGEKINWKVENIGKFSRDSVWTISLILLGLNFKHGFYWMSIWREVSLH